MIIVLLVFLGAMIALYLLSKGKYDDYIQPLDKKAYRFKYFMPIGFYLLDAVRYKYASGYDKNLLMKVAEISGHKYSRYYLQVHWANKITLLLIGLLLAAFIGAGAGVDAGYGVFCILVLGGIAYITDHELNEKIKKRRFEIQTDFPDFLNKLTLLINAGMTIGRAWEKIVMDNKSEKPLYQELGIVMSDIRAGKSEVQAYQDFAKRCRIPEITKFVSVIIQNLRKGNSELVSILRLQGNECWEMRKSVAKRLGEEASTKMLLPMMIMFIAILIIVAMPAILAMQGI